MYSKKRKNQGDKYIGLQYWIKLKVRDIKFAKVSKSGIYYIILRSINRQE